jgi:hypothetical protein
MIKAPCHFGEFRFIPPTSSILYGQMSRGSKNQIISKLQCWNPIFPLQGENRKSLK